MIIREHYINQVRPFYDSDLIKIITGIRRSGKSVILKQIMEEIKTKTINILFINFEDYLSCSDIHNAMDLIQYVKDNRKDGWQHACKTLRLHDVSIFITGSNSKLLSGEFTKELSGRFVSFRIRPFVYKEILEYASQLGREISPMDYLIWGGFPDRIAQNDSDSQRRYRIKKTSLFTSTPSAAAMADTT